MKCEIKDKLNSLILKDLELKTIKTKKWLLARARIMGHKLCGKIINKAERTIYKNLTIQLRLLDVKEQTIDKKDYTLQQWFPPHQTKNFEIDLKEIDTDKFNHFIANITNVDIVKRTRGFDKESTKRAIT